MLRESWLQKENQTAFKELIKQRHMSPYGKWEELVITAAA